MSDSVCLGPLALSMTYQYDKMGWSLDASPESKHLQDDIKLNDIIDYYLLDNDSDVGEILPDFILNILLVQADGHSVTRAQV